MDSLAEYCTDSDESESDLPQNDGEDLVNSKPSNFFCLDEDNPNESKSYSDNEDDSSSKSLINSIVPNPHLPRPSFKKASLDQRILPETSIFSNPFQKAEDVKKDLLEKHVKMTAIDDKKDVNNEKTNICYSFLKGKCRRGDLCKYSHSLNFISKKACSSSNNENDSEPSNEEKINFMNMKLKKRAHGVRDQLIPPKKAMMAFQEQRVKEEPWTIR